MLLKSVLAARGKVGIQLNAPWNKLEAIEALLPSLKAPTVSQLATEGWFAVNTIVEESVIRTSFLN